MLEQIYNKTPLEMHDRVFITMTASISGSEPWGGHHWWGIGPLQAGGIWSWIKLHEYGFCREINKLVLLC